MNLSNRGPLGQRQQPVVSKALRDSARGQSCTLQLDCCNHDNATTVLCHIRFAAQSGLGQKPNDFHAVYACSACHDALDGRGKASWGYDDLLRALLITQGRMFRAGLITIKGAK